MRIFESFKTLPIRPKTDPVGKPAEPKEAGRPSGLVDRFVRSGAVPAPVPTIVPSAPVALRAPILLLPQPLPSKLGGTDYYAARAEDFKRRHPELPLPSYYLGYGDKYVHRFTEELAPKLTPVGQEWLAKARLNLQLAIEAELKKDPAAFDRLEQDDEAFLEFAYDTHPKAYLDGGLDKLPIKDLMTIALTPDLKDLASLNGLEQVADVAVGMAAKKARGYLQKGLAYKLPSNG